VGLLYKREETSNNIIYVFKWKYVFLFGFLLLIWIRFQTGSEYSYIRDYPIYLLSAFVITDFFVAYKIIRKETAESKSSLTHFNPYGKIMFKKIVQASRNTPPDKLEVKE